MQFLAFASNAIISNSFSVSDGTMSAFPAFLQSESCILRLELKYGAK